MTRSAAILLHKNQVALIERHRMGKQYYVFPGGTVEEGETLEETCVREMKEELGLTVKVKELLVDVLFEGNHQYYFLCDIESGFFATGNGEEYRNHLPVEQGTYQPIWMDIPELEHHSVYPECVCEAIYAFLDGQVISRNYRDLDNGVSVLIEQEQ